MDKRKILKMRLLQRQLQQRYPHSGRRLFPLLHFPRHSHKNFSISFYDSRRNFTRLTQIWSFKQQSSSEIAKDPATSCLVSSLDRPRLYLGSFNVPFGADVATKKPSSRGRKSKTADHYCYWRCDMGVD